MFHRPTDPPDYNAYYAIPAAVMLAAVAAGSVAGGGEGAASFSAEGLTQVRRGGWGSLTMRVGDSQGPLQCIARHGFLFFGHQPNRTP